VADGPDWRQSVIYYGYPEHLEPAEDDRVNVTSAEGQTLQERPGFSGVFLKPNGSYKEARIFQAGSLVQRELSVFTGTNVTGEPQFDLYRKYVYQNDSLGHATNIVLYDGANSAISRTIYQADFKGSASNDGELPLWETDETGVRTEYSYETLKRKIAITKKGVSASGGFPAQADIVTTFRYDPTGKILEKAVSSGTLSLTNKLTFDIAGRPVSNTDEKGLVTSVVYALGGRRTTTTLPSGATDIQENYLDRRLYTRTGTAVVQETHDYWLGASDPGENMQGITLQEKISYGPSGTRWKKVGTDWFGNTARWEVPDYDITKSVVEWHEFWSSLDRPSAIVRSGQPTQSFLFDFDDSIGETCIGSTVVGTALNTANRISRPGGIHLS